MRNIDRRKFIKGVALPFGLPAVFRSIPSFAAEPVTATVQNGALKGIRDNGVVGFKGVPYAADTAGANRFKAPQPVKDWSEVRDATHYGSLCPQTVTAMPGPSIFDWMDQHDPLGEDCCVLNIFTPDLDRAARRPVMFYIHGGGYSNGGGGGAALDGTNLANFGDVVVVTINHRLNAFGYTNLSYLDAENFGDAANTGHLDILAALRWARTLTSLRPNSAVATARPGTMWPR